MFGLLQNNFDIRVYQFSTFATLLGSMLKHFLLMLAKFWNHLKNMSGAIWDSFQTMSGPFLNNFGIIGQPLWDRFGIMWEHAHFSIILKQFWQTCSTMLKQFCDLSGVVCWIIPG